jgi:tRNA G10  N-methylase Trm11
MITLITPPDIFENENLSLVFMNISDQEQEDASHWLSNNNIDKNINLYYYQGETNIPWLLHAIAISKGVYLNCNNNSDVTKWITSFILGKSNVWYKSEDANFRALMNYINQKPVNNIKEFLEVHLGK